MSAFIVNDATIKAIAVYGSATPVVATLLAQILLGENYRSVNHRHKQQDTPHEITVTHGDFVKYSTIPTMTLLKAIDCLEYQSCETDNFLQTQAFQKLSGMRERLISQLPGYEQAPWGIPESLNA